MAEYPTRSSQFEQMWSAGWTRPRTSGGGIYDLAELDWALNSVLHEGKAKPPAPRKPDPPVSTLEKFHLHTLSLEATLLPPAATTNYYDGPRENPAYAPFIKFRDALCEAQEPFRPLALAAAQAGLLHIPSQTRYSAQIDTHGKPHLRLPGMADHTHVASFPKLAGPRASASQWTEANAWDMRDWLQAILSLDPDETAARKGGFKESREMRRFTLETAAALCWVPDEDGDAGIPAGPEVKLVVEIDVFVNIPNLLASPAEPLPELAIDQLGLILSSLLPEKGTDVQNNRMTETELRSAGLKFFFGCLRPATGITKQQSEALQPKELVSKLLPFQKRTLQFLLERENACLQGKDARDPDGFWSLVVWKDRRIAYRRLTGTMVDLGKVDKKGKGKKKEADETGLTEEEKRSLPCLVDLNTVRGTLLCEEMGLGKTVEAVSLILLNRHPLSTPRAMPSASKERERQPEITEKNVVVPTIDLLKGVPGTEHAATKKWIAAERKAFQGRTSYDETAQVNVTEVATTLIVTPPSLLRQWIAEMQTHAPSLRVCVYDGWKSLQKGVEEQRRKREKVAKDKGKRKAETFRRETVRKYSKGKGGRRVKVEYEEEDEDEDEDEDDFTRPSPGEEDNTLEITQRQFVEYVQSHDVVVTTYPDLADDLKVAHPPPARSRRNNASYRLSDRPRSPLVMVEWWRVIMDEVQLQGDLTSSAQMVALIPRVCSLAVSGTPAKNDIKDLIASLKFLRVPTIPNVNKYWYRLLQPTLRPAFEGLFQAISVRTTKKEVASEFLLPAQSRFVVPIELSPIELTYYNDTLDRQRTILRIDEEGQPTVPNWVLDKALFRSCLMNLRQICTHIQVGGMAVGPGRREQRLNLGKELMTMAEALERMRNDHQQDVAAESRLQMKEMIHKGQLIMTDDKNDLRCVTAINLYYERVREIGNKQLDLFRQQEEKLVGELKELRASRGDRLASEESESDSDEGNRLSSQAEKEKGAILRITRQQIRETTLLLHQSWFFEGDAWHVSKDEDKEVMCYGQADILRKELLSRPLQRSNESVVQMERHNKRSPPIRSLEELQSDKTTLKGALMSGEIVDQANDLIKILDDNALLVFNWREKIMQLLASPVESDQAEKTEYEGTDVKNPDEEYYAEALTAQGDVEAFMIAYAAAVADRKEMLLEERSLLATHDAEMKKKRITKAAQNAMEDDIFVPDGAVGDQTAILMAERQAFRDARKDRGCERPLKGLLMDLNEVIHGPHRAEEVAIAQSVAMKIKSYITKQTDMYEKLTKELETFRSVFNRRVTYFASLQEISDSVLAPQWSNLSLEAQIAASTRIIDGLEVSLAKKAVKGRYLQFLGSREDQNEAVKENCIICFGTSDDTQAALLECGHAFCISCFREYRRSTNSRRCPTCKTEINDKEIAKISLVSTLPQPLEMVSSSQQEGASESQEAATKMQEAAPEVIVDEKVRREEDLLKLRSMSVVSRREIALMDMMGDYGSKINFLIKHLLVYKSQDPDARHVIFSNWSDSLRIVVQALQRNRIKFVTFESGKRGQDILERFKKDKTITVFLLHAERESSGLTLTMCKVVHLLEPVLRHSFELQAIGRVDRLGQTNETSVFCYATKDTVESHILSQGVRNGTSIYLKDENADSVVASMPNVVSAAHKGGDLSNDGNEEELLKLIV